MFHYRYMAWLLLLTACKKEYDLPEQPIASYTKIYMPQAVITPAEYVLKLTDAEQHLVFSASYGGQDYPEQPIEVSFAVNAAAVDSFNQANNTSYPMLPATCYSLSADNATIPAGQLSTGPLHIAVKTTGPNAMQILKDYLLAVSITVKGAAVNAGLRTAFFKVRAQPELKDYPPYDRSGWSIVDFSSEEANGEGPDNGHALHVLDDDQNTFWHSQWQGGSPGPPHHITLDLGSVKTVHGLSFLNRQNNNSGKPKDVLVQVSTDNISFTDAGSFTLANTKDLQQQFVSAFVDARYVKVIVQNSYSASFVHLAELKVF